MVLGPFDALGGVSNLALMALTLSTVFQTLLNTQLLDIVF